MLIQLSLLTPPSCLKSILSKFVLDILEMLIIFFDYFDYPVDLKIAENFSCNHNLALGFKLDFPCVYDFVIASISNYLPVSLLFHSLHCCNHSIYFLNIRIDIVEGRRFNVQHRWCVKMETKFIVLCFLILYALLDHSDL